MDLLVRYSEIHTKKGKTRQQLVQTLRQRIQDKLQHREIQFDSVSTHPGRIKVSKTDKTAKEAVSQLPGVQSCSLTHRTDNSISQIKRSINIEKINGSFGVRAKSRTDQSATELERVIGSYIQEETGFDVDLDNPDTWLKIELDNEGAYIYTDKDTAQGPGGLPVASQGNYVTLVSGGIDSPVAAFQIMKRGADIYPLYFYNRPYAAEDHLLRFQSVLEELKKIHPGKKWRYGVVDMKDVNEKLSGVDKGRMVLHRMLMYEVAEKFREEKNYQGIVTGESMAQKSSQTPQNMYVTGRDLPIFRPLLCWNKEDITDKARDLGTFEYSKIDSACRTISPDSPSTNMKPKEINRLKSKVGFEELIKEAYQSLEIKEI